MTRKNDDRLNEQQTTVNGRRNNNYCWASPSSRDAYSDCYDNGCIISNI